MKHCECGCGETIPWKPHHKYKAPRFLPGHWHQSAEFRKVRKRTIATPPDDWEEPSGFCECGCGEKTPIAKATNRKRGQYRGYPIRYIRGHHMRGKSGSDAHPWNGGRRKSGEGYVLLHMPDHHLAMSTGYVMEHRLVWEQTNGRRLRPNEDVHHIDGDRENNDPENLVALTKSAHAAHHHRERRKKRRKH